MLLQILVRLQNCCTQSFRSSLGIIRFSSPLAAPTGTCRDCRRLFIEQSLPVQEGILQSDATGHQDLDKKEWPTLHATGQHFGFVPPPLVRTYPTGHQSHYKILHQPTSIHIRRSHFPLRGHTLRHSAYTAHVSTTNPLRVPFKTCPSLNHSLMNHPPL